MDPYIQQNRSFDTDLLILRSLFALDPVTQLPISTGYILTTDGLGGLSWISPLIFGGISLPNLVSTVEGLGSTRYVSTSFLDRALTSTSFGLGNLSYVSTSGLNAILTSTTRGLGTINYLSTGNLNAALASTNTGLGTLNYVSVAGLNAALRSTTGFFLDPVRYVTASNLTSTTTGILDNPTFYASHEELRSTIDGLGTFAYISTSTLQTSLRSTVAGLGRVGYVSTSGLNVALRSTAEGLGTLGFLSAAGAADAINSTVKGLGTVNYVSISYLVKYVTDALANVGTTGNYISAATLNTALVSTNNGLGTFGYISTSGLNTALASTTSNIFDPVRYISVGNLLSTTEGVLAAQTSAVNNAALISTVTGLGTAAYISTASLRSTIIGLGTVGYISAASLRSTIIGLGTASYISTQSLTSTVASLLNVASSNTFINIDRGGNLVITGGQISVSSLAGDIVYLSTFVFSSVTYRGTNGNLQAVVLPNPTTGRDLIFSTCVIPFDTVSSYMNSNSRIYVDVYPTFAFNELNTGATGSIVIPLSTTIYRGTTLLGSAVNTSYVVANSKTAGYSNYFQAPIKLQVPGNSVAGFFDQQFILYHYMPNALTLGVTPGLKSNAVTVQYSSTNSIFLSLQNLP